MKINVLMFYVFRSMCVGTNATSIINKIPITTITYYYYCVT